jgi:hypothetical protein
MSFKSWNTANHPQDIEGHNTCTANGFSGERKNSSRSANCGYSLLNISVVSNDLIDG